MRIIAHRGLAASCREPGGNSMEEIERAWMRGLDVEIDVWLVLGQLLVTHDSPQGMEGHPSLRDVFLALRRYPERRAWVNVKTSGALGPIFELAESHQVLAQIMVFDFAMPELLYALRKFPSLPIAMRLSEYERPRTFGIITADKPRPTLGIWVDRFRPTGFSPAMMLRGVKSEAASCGLLAGKVWVALVSPEIHWPEAETEFNYPGLIWEIEHLGFDVSVLTDLPGRYYPAIVPNLESL